MYKVYGHNQCMWCKQALKVLEDQQEDHIYIDVKQDQAGMVEYLHYGFKTVPLILDDGVVVGGFDKLTNYMEAKSLGSFDLDL